VTRSIPDTERPNLERRRLLVGLGFLGAAGVAAARMPSEKIDYLGKKKLEDIIPKQIGNWKFETASGLVIPPEDQLSNALYSQLLTRVYSNEKGAPIMLLVAQSGSQTGVLQIHRPEVCYPAGGFSLSPVTPLNIDVGGRTLTTNNLQAVGDQRVEQIVYWTRIGNHLPPSWAQQRWAVARDNLAGKIPDAILVRVSTIDNDRGAANAMLANFTRDLLQSMAPNDRKILVGPA
jgi:EpsI family protein